MSCVRDYLDSIHCIYNKVDTSQLMIIADYNSYQKLKLFDDNNNNPFPTYRPYSNLSTESSLLLKDIVPDKPIFLLVYSSLDILSSKVCYNSDTIFNGYIPRTIKILNKQ